MPPRLPWSKLIPGLIALAVMVAAWIAVFVFAGVGKVRGETVRIVVLTDQARGVMKGTEVWLDGQRAGVVAHIAFRPPSADTLQRVVIAADVLAEAAERLRHDSRIQVRPGTVIGPVVLFLESGTPDGATVRAGDTLRAIFRSDVAVVKDHIAGVTIQLPALFADAKTVVRQARGSEGTIGAFLTRGMPAEAAELRANLAALRAGMSGSGGTPRAGTLRRDVTIVMARVDSVRALLAAPHSSLGRFRRDSTLGHAIAGIRAELDSLQREMAEATGTLWRLQNDSALTRAVADARREMALLFEDVKRNPLRYIHF